MSLPSPDNYQDWRSYASALINALQAADVDPTRPTGGGGAETPPAWLPPLGYRPVWLSEDDANLYLADPYYSPPTASALFRIDTTNLANAAVQLANMGDNAVGSAQIVDAAIISAKIADAAILTALIGDAQIVTAKIADLAVNTAKIANLAVTSAKIANLAVGNAQIANQISSADWNPATGDGWLIDRQGNIQGKSLTLFSATGDAMTSAQVFVRFGGIEDDVTNLYTIYGSTASAAASASAAFDSSVEAGDHAAAALASSDLAAGYSLAAATSVKLNKPRGMSGGADWYNGSAGWAFGTEGGGPVINATGGGAMDVYPKWAYPATPNRTYRLFLQAKTATGTRDCFFARGNATVEVNPAPDYVLGVGSVMTFGTTETVQYHDYTVPASPAAPFVFFFFNIQPDSEQIFVRDFWVEDVTELIDAEFQAEVATDQAAIATDQAALAALQVQLTASLAYNSLNKNASFLNWPGATGTIPADWVDWINGGSNVKAAGDLGGNAYRGSNAVGVNQGIACYPAGMVGKKTSGWFVVEADIVVNVGNLQGVGVHLAKTGWNSGADIHFPALIDPATGAAYGIGTTGKRYSFKKLINIPEAGGTSDYTMYLMTCWGGFDGALPLRDVTWYRCSIRDATLQEVRDQTVLGPLQSTVTTQAAAIVDLEGRTEAFWQVEAVAGGRAQLRVYADANGGGGVDIVGDVQIDGDLLVTGSVNTNQLAANAASAGTTVYNAGSVALTTSWQDAAEVTLTMIGGAAKIDFATYIAGQGVSAGTNVLFRILRNGTEIRTGTLMLFPGEQTVYGGTVGENPYPVYTPVAGMFPAIHIDTSGPTGSVTYKVQLKLATSGNTSYSDFAERLLAVTEFRR